MDIEILKTHFRSNGEILRDKNKHLVDKAKFKAILDSVDVFIKREDLEGEYTNAVKLLHNVGFDHLGFIRESLNKKEIFKGFKARGCTGSNSIIYYSEDGIRNYCLGAAMDLDINSIYHKFTGDPLYYQIVEEWRIALKPHAESLKISIVDTRRVIETIWEKIFTAAKDMEQDEIDFSMPPAILEGFGKGTEFTIPFTKKHSTLDELHPILKDFLVRMEDHQYFCAILASKLIGKFKHYIPWLYGKGGEGKSTFIRFLNEICPDSSVELSLTDKSTGLWEALGKTFLIIPDTNNKNIFHYEEVKKISGGDAVVINGKYKHPRTEKLPGMIIVSSNKLPNVGSYTYAQRRARIFKISSGNFSGTRRELGVDKAAKEMATTTNEFLNYCLQCLDEVGDSSTGQVPEPPSTITNNTKSLEEYEYIDFIEETKLSLHAESSISGKELRKLLKKDSKNRSDFFIENFLEYIHNYCKVSFKDETYQGIGRSNQKKVNDLETQRLEAMPND